MINSTRITDVRTQISRENNTKKVVKWLVSSLTSGDGMEKSKHIQKHCGGFCQHNVQGTYLNEILRALKPIRNNLFFLKNSEKHDLAPTKRFLTELNAGIQIRVISSDNKATNNKNITNQEANQKQKGRQFTLNLPVVIPATGKPFLYLLSSQGEKSC